MFPLYDTNPHRRTPWVTLLLIATNAIVFFWMGQQPALDQAKIVYTRGFVPKRISQLSDKKVVIEVDLAPDDVRRPPGLQKIPKAQRMLRLEPKAGEICFSLLTMMFLHGGWWHLIGNMWFLWIFGNNIEDRLGHVIYPCFYLLGGLLAMACHWVADPQSTVPVIGASGAVAAVLGAYAITYPTAKVRTLVFLVFIVTVVDLPALLVLGFWFAAQIGEGLLGPANVPGGGENVAWWAHVGGFVAGMTLMPLLSLGAPPPDEDWRDEAQRLFNLPE